VSALTACSLWGVSAVAAQFIFEAYSFPPLALVAIRMPLAGVILYVVFRPARPRARLGAFLVFSVVGLWVVQYTYFLTIASSNAATATLLQFLALPMIAAFEILASKTRATAMVLAADAVATIGTAELAAGRPNGSLALLITPLALVAGLLTAGSAAYYTIASKSLLKRYGSVTVTTWGFFFGSAVALPAGYLPLSGYAIPEAPGGPLELLALVLFVVVCGTLLSFLLYFKGLEKITPTEAGISAAMEPITAAVVSFLVLHVVLTPFQYLGGLLIIGAVAIIVFRARLQL
jgi:drug/metabolite transporter (DMT)-like permease